MDAQKNDQIAKTAYFYQKVKLPNEEALSQTTITILNKIGKVEVNNNQHVTENMKIDRFDDTQLGIEKEVVADSREGQILYSRAVKKSLP
ncbi:4708_t:CDS:2 [Gigaspora margarita]|uniref:4708_t:CDS:1 n=1 Tax=Gigaspora margarita TaxID=4874 RepID=A0ABM8W540_GIGMA|nr:4708_t:CDS:2 [Gigaspora margarita]